jgi:hypothetical protein
LVEKADGEPSRRVAVRPTTQTYRRALDDALRQLATVMCGQLANYVREAGTSSCCLALRYEPGMPLPLTPVLGPSEFAEAATADPDRLWNPAEWPGVSALGGQGEAALNTAEIRALVNRVRDLDGLTADERADQAIAMLDELAASLTRALADRPAGPLPRFIVYAADVPAADLRKHLVAATDAETMAALSDRGLLPGS